MNINSILESCANKIFNSDFTGPGTHSIPAHLSRAHAAMRNKNLNGMEDAKQLIRNQQDVKDTFWRIVEEKGLKIDEVLASELKNLIVD